MTPSSAEQELEWYFCRYDAEMGNRSNFGAMLEQIRLGADVADTLWSDPFSAGQMKAVAKARRVRTRLAKMPTHLQKALQWVYGGIISGVKQPKNLLLACKLHNEALLMYCSL